MTLTAKIERDGMVTRGVRVPSHQLTLTLYTMRAQDRLPKADYFRARYTNAVENGLTSKAEYYKSRLVDMGEWVTITDTYKSGNLTRTELTSPDLKSSIVFYSW